LKGVRARSAGNRPRYGAALRKRCLEYLKASRAEGRSVMEVAGILGIPEGTLYRWQEQAVPGRNLPAKRRAESAAAGKGVLKAAAFALRPVVVTPDEASPTPREIAVVSPSGYRLTGLTLHEGAWVLRALQAREALS